MTSQARFVDESTRRIPGRIGEHRPGVAPAGLMFATPADDLADLLLCCLAIARYKLELGPFDDLMSSDVGAAIAELQAFGHAGAVLSPVQVDESVATERLNGLRAM